MPTCDVTHTTIEFEDCWKLMHFLRDTGEQSCMVESRNFKSRELFTAVGAIYQTLFNMKTNPPNLANSVLIDNFKGNNSSPNIIATFDYVNFIGWKYHEKQQKSKQRGSAKFSLKQVVKDMNAEAKTEEEKIKYGVIIDDGDNIKEEN